MASISVRRQDSSATPLSLPVVRLPTCMWIALDTMFPAARPTPGSVSPTSRVLARPWPIRIYNLVPERGYPAQFGFMAFDERPSILSVFPRPRTASDSLTLAIPNNVNGLDVSEFTARLCGYGVEGDGTDSDPYVCGSPSGLEGAPFLSNPLNCSETEPISSIAIDSLEHAGALREIGVPDFNDPDWKTASVFTPPVTGCNDPLLANQFDFAISTTPLQLPGGPVRADQPSGFRVEINFPQSNDPTDLDTEFDPELPQAPAPKEIRVKLPAGLVISPATADGLDTCSDQDSDPAGDQVHYDNMQPVQCPDASTIGTAVATSPLLATRDPITGQVNGAEPIPGELFVVKPHPGDLPFGTNANGRFRLLIVLENSRYGVNLKLPGIATADKDTGQMTAVFTESPQLPASHLTIELKAGPRAPLVTPPVCGEFTTTSTLVPWSTPGTPDVHPSASFDVVASSNGSTCSTSAAARSFTPVLDTAGSDNDSAGAASPFTLRLTRPDGDQELSSLEVTAPPGFTAKLAGVPTCSGVAIAAAADRSGVDELADPSCPGASQVGTATAGAGPGTNPYYTTGKAYLAGPYKGAPLSLVFIIPAVAGSFDLGTVVVRAATEVDPETAQVTVRTDPLPRILDGIPLRLRSLTARLDRTDFTRNPTNCEPMSLGASVKGANGASAEPSFYFQVGGCNELNFKPKLSLHLLNGFARNRHPALRAVLRAGSGEAGISAANVTLPAGELLDLQRLPAMCARKLRPELCPRSSRLGNAKVWSPLLGEALQGPIYLRAPRGRFPDLIADLRGAGLRFILHGRTSVLPRRLRISFPLLPDIPLTKADFTFAGGRRGLIVNSDSLCDRVHRASVRFSAHNGDLFVPAAAADC